MRGHRCIHKIISYPEPHDQPQLRRVGGQARNAHGPRAGDFPEAGREVPGGASRDAEEAPLQGAEDINAVRPAAPSTGGARRRRASPLFHHGRHAAAACLAGHGGHRWRGGGPARAHRPHDAVPEDARGCARVGRHAGGRAAAGPAGVGCSRLQLRRAGRTRPPTQASAGGPHLPAPEQRAVLGTASEHRQQHLRGAAPPPRAAR